MNVLQQHTNIGRVMDFPVVTKPLALRVGKSEADYFDSWLQVMQTQGNPFGIEIRQFGNAVALVNTDAVLGPTFNLFLVLGTLTLSF